MDTKFGEYLRAKRLARMKQNQKFSLRGLAAMVEVQPSYISKIERCEVPPPSDGLIVRIAEALGEDPDLLLALAGRVAKDVQEIILQHPNEFSNLLRRLRNLDKQQMGTFVAEACARYGVGSQKEPEREAEKLIGSTPF